MILSVLMLKSMIFLSKLLHRLSHVKVPEGVHYSAKRELKYEFLDNTADIQVHSCMNVFSIFIF